MILTFLVLLIAAVFALYPLIKAKQWKACALWGVFGVLCGALIVLYFTGATLSFPSLYTDMLA